ncbi:MAG: LysR family transcriptional regulator [Mesorhizobium sp.]|uniref:LysR substrate-binding domain-containing protein n=1 Tax=Mesorhizobium sp. TaxID=1871066 RepID=UPI000FE55A75|nr:LysR substrate-binding domain-containing protein [Mesorhizobium sp.]RWE19961.1 MAG: LysR family transcriptional regulator [Mesorhizobium sp.]
MVRKFYDLPSLTTLAVFEASARHLSFRVAASELNVTPSAVSRQVKAIEDELGAPLFVRNSRGVELTQAGEDLYQILASGFSRASEQVRAIKRGDRVRNVTIACTDAVASNWLIPRMPDFWERYPEIAVDHLISDNTKDYRRTDVELSIRYGWGGWSGETPEHLFDEAIYPVCGPEFAARHQAVTPETLGELPLLHVDWSDPAWGTWSDVLSRANVPHTSNIGRRFSKMSVAVQAAMANQGVVIGFGRLVRDLLADGRLVRLTDLVIPGPGAYYLTTSNNRELSRAATVLRDWLREMAEKERGWPLT